MGLIYIHLIHFFPLSLVYCEHLKSASRIGIGLSVQQDADTPLNKIVREWELAHYATDDMTRYLMGKRYVHHLQTITMSDVAG